MTFKQIFFRIYDRKIANGEITFSQTGISKNDFTKLCTEENFVFDLQTIEKLTVTMGLSEEEKAQLLAAAGREESC